MSPQSSEKLFCSNTYKFADSPPCRSLTFLLDVGIELTANQCQSVCVSLAVPKDIQHHSSSPEYLSLMQDYQGDRAL